MLVKIPSRGFPGGPAVKNLPCDARDTGLISAMGRFHTPQGTWGPGPRVLSQSSRAHEPQQLKSTLLECVFHHKRSHGKNPARRCGEGLLTAAARESPHAATKTHQSHKNNKQIFLKIPSWKKTEPWVSRSYHKPHEHRVLGGEMLALTSILLPPSHLEPEGSEMDTWNENAHARNRSGLTETPQSKSLF